MPIGRDKVRPAWPIPITTEELFREFVVKKHGIYAKGMLGEEANKAYLAYMMPFLKFRGISAQRTENRKARTHNSIVENLDLKGQPRAQELHDRIVSFLIEKKRFEPSQVSEFQYKISVGLRMLKEAIVLVEGVSDQRSINDRLILLESSGLIKKPDPGFKIYEVLISDSSNSTLNSHMAKPPRGVIG